MSTITIKGKEITVPVTMTDRIVNYFSPIRGAARYSSRARTAISGGYTSADKTRRANQLGSRRETDADSNILPDLQTLREDSQHLLRNSPLAGGAVQTNVTKIVGTGLKVKPQLDRAVLNISVDEANAWERQAEREFRLATETREFDTERQLPFSLLQSLAFLKVLEDGDVFINLPRLKRAGSPYATKIQLIEGARVCNPKRVPDTQTLVAGVGKDNTGAPTIYHVASRHPGAVRTWRNKNDIKWTPLPAFGKKTGAPLVLHLFDKTRPGQTRGVPYLAPVIELIKQLGRYTDAEVMAAVVSGMLTVFVTNETGNPQFGPAPTQAESTGDVEGQVDTTGMELGYGSVVGLMPGEKIESVNPGRPNPAFDPFVTAVLRQIGARLEIPFELLVKHFTSSYSASRAALNEAWSYFNRRRHWLVTMLCQPIYETVITEAVAMGRLQAPGYLSDPLVRKAWLGTLWTGDAQPSLDPVKDAKAADMRINTLHITTHDEECRAYNGSDWEAKLPRIVENNKKLIDGGLSEDSASATVSDNSQADATAQIATFKDTADAYGVAVRAGSVTPQIEDEQHFRSLIGLPGTSQPVKDAWASDGNVRRPVTLQSGEAFDAAQDDITGNDNQDADDPEEP